MTDLLTDLLATALFSEFTSSAATASEMIGSGLFGDDLQRVRKECSVKDADMLIAAIPPDKADDMRAGLLWAEVDSHPDWRISKALPVAPSGWEVVLIPRAAGVMDMRVSYAPTLLAALTDLLAKLRGDQA